VFTIFEVYFSVRALEAYYPYDLFINYKQSSVNCSDPASRTEDCCDVMNPNTNCSHDLCFASEHGIHNVSIYGAHCESQGIPIFSKESSRVVEIVLVIIFLETIVTTMICFFYNWKLKLDWMHRPIAKRPFDRILLSTAVIIDTIVCGLALLILFIVMKYKEIAHIQLLGLQSSLGWEAFCIGGALFMELLLEVWFLRGVFLGTAFAQHEQEELHQRRFDVSLQIADTTSRLLEEFKRDGNLERYGPILQHHFKDLLVKIVLSAKEQGTMGPLGSAALVMATIDELLQPSNKSNQDLVFNLCNHHHSLEPQSEALDERRIYTDESISTTIEAIMKQQALLARDRFALENPILRDEPSSPSGCWFK
jgi:hypothetical protein